MTIKELREKKASLIEELEGINNTCEERAQNGGSIALTEEEAKVYSAKSTQLDAVCAALNRKMQLRANQIDNPDDKGDKDDKDNGNDGGEDENEATAENEERAFRDYIVECASGVSSVESRAATNMTQTANGAIIPKTIAKKVIDKVENFSDIYKRATKYHFKGEVSFPVIDTSADDVVVGYADEFVELTSHVNKFTSVTLKGYLFGALSLISRSLINNTDINLVSIITTRMALAIRRFLEKECLNGTSDKMTGVLSSTNVVTGASSTAISLDEVIELQDTIPDEYQKNAVYIVHPKTKTALKKLKDSQGRYLLNNDVTTGFTDKILGHPVLISDQMPQIGAGNTAMFYGDPSGLYINIVEDMNVQVLREKYATMHAIGINLWAEMDSKIVEPQKLAVYKCAAATPSQGG